MTVRIIKRVRPGSGIRIKSDSYRVLMQNMNPGPRLNKWEPITAHGFMVVCQSYVEASELVLFVGGPLHVRPSSAMSDEDYEKWLLKHWFVIEPWDLKPARFEERETLEMVDGKPRVMMGVNVRDMEFTFALFIRGWYPAAEDMPGIVHNNTGVMTMLEGIIRSRWTNR